MRDTRARLMFSSEAREFLRSVDSLSVRTRPFDTVQNSADNSLSLRCCSSRFDIRRMFSSFCSRPRSSGPFMRKRPHDRADGLSTNCTGTAVAPQGKAREGSGLFVAPGRMASGSVHSEMALWDRQKTETMPIQNLSWLQRKSTQGARYCAVETGLKISSQSPWMAA